MNIVCVGDCGLDRYVETDQSFVGGITANVARNLRSDLPEEFVVQVISCVGDDSFSDQIVRELDEANIECHIERMPGLPSTQDIRIDADGEKQFVRYDEGVLGDFKFNSRQRTIIETADVIIAPIYEQIREFFDQLMAIRTQGIVCVDFADFSAHPDVALVARYMTDIDIAFFGLTLADANLIDRIANLATESETIFVVTLADKGSRVYKGSIEHVYAADPIDEVVDTTGAGDAYAAGFISAYVRDKNIPEAMAHASLLARKALSGIGSFHDGK